MRAPQGPRWRLVGVASGWLAVAAVVVLAHMHAFTMLSYIDEFQHVDYLQKTMHLEHVRGGEKVGQTAMREQACRGIDYDSVLPSCDAKRLRPEQFPGQGFNHTYSDPPTYYVVTGVGAGAVRGLLGVDSLVTAGRLIGVAWLGAGLFVAYLLSRRLGATRWPAVGTTLLLAATPTVVLPSASVTTDAPMLLVGGVLCLTALAVDEGRLRYWWLAPAAFLAMAMKTTALPAVGFVVIFLLARRREDSEATEVPLLRMAGLTLVAGALPALVWRTVTSRTKLPAVEDIPMSEYFAVDSVPLWRYFDSLATTVTPVIEPSSPPFLLVLPVEYAVVVLNLVLLFGVVALAWFWPLASRLGGWGAATLVTVLVTGPGYVVLLLVTEGVTFIIPGRYGLVMLPAIAACLAVVASRRPAGGPLLVLLGLVELGLLVGYAL